MTEMPPSILVLETIYPYFYQHMLKVSGRIEIDEIYYRHLKETTNLEYSFVEYNKSSPPPEKELEMTHSVTYNDLHINTDNNTNKRYTNTSPNRSPKMAEPVPENAQSRSPNRSPKNPEAPDRHDDASSKRLLVANEVV